MFEEDSIAPGTTDGAPILLRRAEFSPARMAFHHDRTARRQENGQQPSSPGHQGDPWLQDPHVAYPSGIAATAYDTAWLSSIPACAHTPGAGPLFPATLEWLKDHQAPDGSWGSAVHYVHDRVLCTLAALVPLTQYNDDDRHSQIIAAGTRYLWQNGHRLAGEPTEPVAFELLLPTMVRRAQLAGIHVPPHLDIYRTERAEKLRLIPAGALYSPRVTIVHSLEFLGEQADLAGLYAAQGKNGAIGNSPAATAFFFSLSRDDRALRYLQSCLDRYETNRAPVLFPSETYELLWSAYHLFLAGVPVRQLLTQANIATLQSAMADGGVSLSPSFPIPDADDTAVALLFLHELGLDPDPTVLQVFALPEGHFASFPYERHSSVGVSLHVLHALLKLPAYPDVNRTIIRLLDYLTSQQVNGLYWPDKWHISPYYATAHALCILRELPPHHAARMAPLVQRARQWICRTQNTDGSWGFYGQSTLEETGYALLALTAGKTGGLSQHDQRCSDLAAEYLLSAAAKSGELLHGSLPALWIDKCLYSPTAIVWAVVEAALEAHRRKGFYQHG